MVKKNFLDWAIVGGGEGGTMVPHRLHNNSFSKIQSINCDMDGFRCRSWAKMSQFIPL
jgi:hypothetical protein